MGMCYSLRPRLFGEPSGSISDSDQPPDSTAPLRAGALRHEDNVAYSETVPLRDCQLSRENTSKPSAGNDRRRDTAKDGVLMQNGSGGGTERTRRLPLLQRQSTQKQNKWDKLLEKEAEKEAKKISKHIDRTLKAQKQEYEKTHRLLLLGKCEWVRTCYSAVSFTLVKRYTVQASMSHQIDLPTDFIEGMRTSNVCKAAIIKRSLGY